MVEYTGLTQNSTKILKRNKVISLYRNMRECILEVKPKGLWWQGLKD